MLAVSSIPIACDLQGHQGIFLESNVLTSSLAKIVLGQIRKKTKEKIVCSNAEIVNILRPICFSSNLCRVRSNLGIDLYVRIVTVLLLIR